MTRAELRTRDLRDTIKVLSDFIDGTSRDYDWDGYTSCSISDRDLDAIRREAVQIDLPVDEEGMTELRALLARARYLDPSPRL